MSAIVIDPEDRGAIEKFARHYVTAYMERVGYGTPWEERKPERREQIIGDVQTTFRAMQEPPKPPEPTGIGALVEDSSGAAFVRVARGSVPWQCVGSGLVNPRRREWSDLDVARVLSEGVTP